MANLMPVRRQFALLALAALLGFVACAVWLIAWLNQPQMGERDVGQQADRAPNPSTGTSSSPIYRSDDHGLSWQPVGTGLPDLGRIHALTVQGMTAFAGSDNGLFVSADGGRSWSECHARPDSPVHCFAVAQRSVFAGTMKSGVWVTEDAGRSWRPTSNGLPDMNVRSLAVLGSAVYAGTDSRGVYVLPASTAEWIPFGQQLPDGSQVFELSATDQWVYAALYSKGLYRLGHDGGQWTQVGAVRPLRFHVRGEILLAGHNPGGVHRSADGGQTWVLADGTFDHSPTWVLGNAGPNVLVGTSPGAVAVSRDAGLSWQPSAAGLPAGTAVVALACDNSYVLAAVLPYRGR